jgi:hypothetical protein
MALQAAAAVAAAKTASDARKSAAKTAQRNYDANMANILRQQQIDAKQRQDALAKASASQRARFGALGIGSAEGSSGAVLDGLQAKTAEDIRTNAGEYSAQVEKLNNSYADTRADLLADKNDTVGQLSRWYASR